MQAHILMFGNNRNLLDLRARVLSLEGWRVTTVCQAGLVPSVSPQTTFDLAIMCHTLNTSQRDQAIAFTRTLWPNVQIIVLTWAVDVAEDAWPNVTAVGAFEPEKLAITCDRLIKAAWSARTRHEQNTREEYRLHE